MDVVVGVGVENVLLGGGGGGATLDGGRVEVTEEDTVTSGELALVGDFGSEDEMNGVVALIKAVGDVAGLDDVGVSLLLSTDTSKTMATTKSTPMTPSVA